MKQRVEPFRSLQSFTESRRRSSHCPIHFINGCPDLVFGPDDRAKNRDAGRGRGKERGGWGCGDDGGGGGDDDGDDGGGGACGARGTGLKK